MKKITLLAASLFTTAIMLAQAVLPTSWDSSGNPPAGWTISGTTTYTGSGNPLPAVRFDTQGDFIEIAFLDEPGALTYDITGNPPTGSSWAGLFEVLESADGTNFTVLRSFTTMSEGAYAATSDSPLSTTRVIRFKFTTKTTGNVGLDNVSIALPVAGPTQDIDVLSGTERIPSGGMAYISSAVGSSAPLTLVVKNEGTVNNLIVSSAVLSGPDAARFNVSTTPSTIAAQGQSNLVVDFSPLVSGTHHAVLTINSDDPNEAAYVVNLYGVGGTLATEPSAQASSLTFTNVKSYRYTVNYTPATADGYLVLRKTGSAVTDAPVDGTVYDIGDAIGTSKVVYVGSASSFVPNYIIANNTDHFAVFAYNGPSVYVNYLTNAPLAGNVTTLSGMIPANEYAGLNSSSPTFVSDLTALVSPHTRILYGDYSRTLIQDFYERDTTDGQKVVYCVYTGFENMYTPPMDFSVISREHSLPQSWMLTVNSSTFEDQKEYSDYHNLFPVHQNNANAVRSNHPLGKVVNVTSSFMDGKLGTDANGVTVYEPRDEQKGASARAIMYMMVAYNGVSGNWGLDNLFANAQDQDQDILREWHYTFPPSREEIARNDYLDSLQGNRNPFIDSVDYVCYIDFAALVKANLTSPCLISPVGLSEITQDVNVTVFPNPAKDQVEVKTTDAEINSVELIDAQGRTVKFMDHVNAKQVQVQTASMHSGTYFLKIDSNKGLSYRKLILE